MSEQLELRFGKGHVVTPGPDDLECWRPIAGWEGYEVSDWGRVRSFWGKGGESKGRRGLVLTPKIVGGYVMASGHVQAALYRPGSLKPKRPTVHSLVLEAFVGPRPRGKWGLHRDGNPGHNRVGNLYWGDRSDNTVDMLRHGTLNIAVLQESDIPAIWARLVAGIPGSRIAREYRVSPETISTIRTGRTWVHITSSLPGWPLVLPERHDREPVYVPDELCGTPEELWRDIPGYPAYRVSNRGRVQGRWERVAGEGSGKGRWRLGDQWVDRPLSLNLDGYLAFNASDGVKKGNRFLVHKAVLLAFAGPRPEGFVGCHNDGDKTNNHASNLRWDTIRSNAIDRERHKAER